MKSIHYIKNVDDLKKISNNKDHVITIGVFDGVHKGHQSLIANLENSLLEDNYNSTLITFQNSPYHFIKKINDNNFYLSTIEEKTEILNRFRLDQIIIIEFNEKINQTTANEFLNILTSNLKMKKLFVGPDFAFGKNREGNIKYLNENQKSLKYELRVAEAFKQHKQIISSTKIKQLISTGDIQLANSYLGRPYNLSGYVIRGEGRGKNLNMPTANIDYNLKKILPIDGIYSSKVIINKEEYIGALSIGNNPTFGQNNDKSVEVHLIDFKDDIYGEFINIKIYKHMRDQIQYNDTATLMIQMQKDLIDIKEYFKNDK
tara:strand:+ start:9693 stop:10643 length:951 start_codon:yes stop_codon:yes gene_type:complete